MTYAQQYTAALAYWMPLCDTIDEAQELAREQVEFYATELNPCLGNNDKLALLFMLNQIKYHQLHIANLQKQIAKKQAQILVTL